MENKKEELLPCPFCGNKNIGISSNGGCYDFKVFCVCGANVGGSEWESEGGREIAIKKWNRRTESLHENLHIVNK